LVNVNDVSPKHGGPPMILTQEVAILKSQEQFDEMLDFVRHAAREGTAIDQVERGLWSRLLSLGHAMLESFVQAQGTGDLGPTIEHAGRTLRRLERPHDRRYVSIFGELTIPRHVYGTRETQKHELVPLDARLNLPEGEFSYVLQDWDQHLCVQGPYAEARETVQEILGLGQSVRSLEDMNLTMSEPVESFRQSQPTPPAKEEEAILVLSSDGKGVPMRKEEMARSGRRKKGEKANKKRMACVGAVYTIAPFVRSADDVVDEVMREKARKNRPAPQHKEVRAELTRPIDGQEVNGKDRIFGWFQQQVAARNPTGDKPVVCVMDGERALWQMLASYLVGIVCILDLFHVLERLWQAAHCFHAEGSDEATAFVTERLKRLLEGKVGYVIGGLKQMGYKQRLKGAKLKQLESAIGYLHNNRRFMRYDEYLAAGYPIGSGVAEGTCRHLVKDRMERTGMRWQVPTAQAMLDLRAVHVSGQWDGFQCYRVKAECHRLYPYQATVESLWPAMAA
jgi:hypothetical protein